MGMFENYQNIPNSYIPCNRHYPKYYPCNKKEPLEEYDAKGNFIGYSWNYRDNIILEFNTQGNVVYDDDGNDFYEEAEDYLNGKTMILKLYNFRGEVSCEASLPAATIVKFQADSKTYPDLVPGTYNYTLTLVDNEDKDDSIEFTLLGPNDGVFIIK